jgi:alkanesulfonate monooxygenase SsuD/methylene tetrahydromethanopterin reductase-like flavin-dependent oxidoreductase (luciferase family)
MTFRHPALVARMAAAIDQLSGGRFILGLGAGWNVPEHEAFGIELPPPRPRIEALNEGVRVIKALFGDKPATVEGKKYQLEEAYLNPKPLQSPLPILIGGGGEKRTLRVVARHAHEWNVVAQSLERYREKVKALEAHCEAVGRDPATIDRSLMMSCTIVENEASLARRLAEMPERLRAVMRPGGGALIGTPSQLVEQIKAWEAEGVSRIMLQHREPPAREDLEIQAQELLSKV